MKKLFFVFVLFILYACQANTSQAISAEVQDYETQSQSVSSDSLMINIQKKIYDTFVAAMMSQKNKALLDLNKELTTLHKEKKQNLILYWQAYLHYYNSIYYLKTQDKDNAEKQIDAGIKLLEDMEKKNSEDYALLAMLQSFSMQFKSGIKAPFISKSVESNAQKAEKLDASNIRAYYVQASNDYYTPAQYGGGKKAEKLLLKAVSLPEQSIKSPYLPSWGKEEAYEMLTKLYIKAEKWEEAKKYYQEGITAYPNSYVISQLATKLVGK
jgi:tetratricopeptide (TPR) repeat protein